VGCGNRKETSANKEEGEHGVYMGRRAVEEKAIRGKKMRLKTHFANNSDLRHIKRLLHSNNNNKNDDNKNNDNVPNWGATIINII